METLQTLLAFKVCIVMVGKLTWGLDIKGKKNCPNELITFDLEPVDLGVWCTCSRLAWQV